MSENEGIQTLQKLLVAFAEGAKALIDADGVSTVGGVVNIEISISVHHEKMGELFTTLQITPNYDVKYDSRTEKASVRRAATVSVLGGYYGAPVNLCITLADPSYTRNKQEDIVAAVLTAVLRNQ